MSDRTFHTGPPAFTSLMPAMPAPQPVPATLARAVSEFCGVAAADVQSLGSVGPTPEGRYVVTPGGDRPLFLKIFDERIVALQQHSDGVASFLDARGVPVVLPLAGGPRPFADGYYGELFPYLDARFSRCDDAELRALGTVLAQLHRALAAFDAAPTRLAADEMHGRLSRAADAVLAGWSPAEGLSEALREAAAGYRGSRLSIHDTPQMIHGDCNYTNILFEQPDGRLVVIDFEESRAAWLNPMFDVAKVIERFVLVPARANAIELARSFLDAYRDGGGAMPAVDLRRILIESNDRALMIMTDKAREGLPLPDAEWRKFIELKALVGRQAALLDSLSQTAADRERA